jgi:Tachylectin
MGKCTISFEHATLINHKSDTDHSDNDWLTLMWTINNEPGPTRVFPILDREGNSVLWDGNSLDTIVDSIDCDDSATVTITAVIMNLSAYDRDKQVEVATTFARDAAAMLASLYIKVGSRVVGIAEILGAPAIGVAISGATVELLNKFHDELIAAINNLFDDVLTPSLKGLVEEVAWLLGGRPNCNGEILHDSFVFLPGQERDEYIRDRTYEGPQTNSHCGLPPHTQVTWWLHRDVAVIYESLPNLAVGGLIYALKPRMEHIPSNLPLPQDHMTNDLLWYNHLGFIDGGGAWQGPRTLGNNWEFQQVFPGVNGAIYAVDSTGILHWYRHNGYRSGMKQWHKPNNIGSGWLINPSSPSPDNLIGAFCETHMDVMDAIYDGLDKNGHPFHFPKTQVIYTVKADGTLWWYRHEKPVTGEAIWTNGGAGKKVGQGWVEGYQRVFSGGSGVIYLIKDDGTLLWYKHLGHESGEFEWEGGHSVYSGLNVMVKVFSIGGGVIYGIDLIGDLWWYKHIDYLTGGNNWAERKQVGNGWNDNGLSVAMNCVDLHSHNELR